MLFHVAVLVGKCSETSSVTLLSSRILILVVAHDHSLHFRISILDGVIATFNDNYWKKIKSSLLVHEYRRTFRTFNRVLFRNEFSIKTSLYFFERQFPV